MVFLLPKPSTRLSVTSDACSATAVGAFPELKAWVAAAAGARFCIKQAQLAELQPQYNAGNLSTPPGDNAGLRLLGRWTAQLEVPLLEQLYPYAMRKLVCARKVGNKLIIMGMANCESRALAMFRLMLSTRRCRHPQAFEPKNSFGAKP
jgi:hypothetical protein